MAILYHYFYKVKEKNFERSARQRDDGVSPLAGSAQWKGQPEAMADASPMKAYILLTSF